VLGVTFKERKMDWMDAEDLAANIMGFPDDYDSDKIENALYERFECSFEQFHKIAEALMPFTIPAKAAISGEVFHGFVKDGAFICKQLLTGAASPRPNERSE
jgi:hypothetical protein